jgi:hypothetical protein
MVQSENEPSAEYAQIWGKKIRSANETYQNYSDQYRYKGNVLVQPMKVSHGTLGFRGTQFEYQCFVQNICPDLETNTRRLVLLKSCWYICKRNDVQICLASCICLTISCTASL